VARSAGAGSGQPSNRRTTRHLGCAQPRPAPPLARDRSARSRAELLRAAQIFGQMGMSGKSSPQQGGRGEGRHVPQPIDDHSCSVRELNRRPRTAPFRRVEHAARGQPPAMNQRWPSAGRHSPQADLLAPCSIEVSAPVSSVRQPAKAATAAAHRSAPGKEPRALRRPCRSATSSSVVRAIALGGKSRRARRPRCDGPAAAPSATRANPNWRPSGVPYSPELRHRDRTSSRGGGRRTQRHEPCRSPRWPPTPPTRRHGPR